MKILRKIINYVMKFIINFEHRFFALSRVCCNIINNKLSGINDLIELN